MNINCRLIIIIIINVLWACCFNSIILCEAIRICLLPNIERKLMICWFFCLECAWHTFISFLFKNFPYNHLPHSIPVYDVNVRTYGMPKSNNEKWKHFPSHLLAIKTNTKAWDAVMQLDFIQNPEEGRNKCMRVSTRFGHMFDVHRRSKSEKKADDKNRPVHLSPGMMGFHTHAWMHASASYIVHPLDPLLFWITPSIYIMQAPRTTSQADVL